MNRWKRLRHRLEYAGVLLLARLVPKLPRKGCYALAGLVGGLVFLFDKRGRTVALANLQAAFGEDLSDSERRRIARDSYKTFARTMFDLFWAPRLNASNFREFINIENEERFQEIHNTGAIFTLTHAGNFELTHMAVGFLGLHGMGVAETFKNPLLTELFTTLRAVGGNQVVEQERSMLRMFKHLKKGGFVGMLIDLNLRPDQPSVAIESFGYKTCVTQIHAALHQRTGAPIYPLYSNPLGGGRYRIRVGEPLRFQPDTPAQEIAQACWNVFEPFIREKPELWMWSYKHWRYRPQETNRPYPFYSNVSKKFEKLLRVQELTKPM